jgi:hypothetical protein
LKIQENNQIPSLDGVFVVVVVVSCSPSSCFCSGVVVLVVDDSSSAFVSLLTGTFGVVVVVFGFGTNL